MRTNLGLFRIRPTHEYVDYSSSHLAKGTDYHKRFTCFPGRSYMADLERDFLTRFVQSRRIHSYLDFASGTGRILEWLRGAATRAYAIDVSESMLAVSQQSNPHVTFLCKDFQLGFEELEGTHFDLITAFRFFANAEPALRLAGMRFLAQKLAPTGAIVLNNHRTFWSLPYVAMRAAFAEQGQYGMTDSEVRALAAHTSLRVANRVSFGIVPQTEIKSVLGWRITRKLERWNALWPSQFHTLGYNTIYVLEHATRHNS